MPVNFQKEKKELVTDFHLTPDVLSQKVSREHKLVIQQTISWKPVGEFLLDEVDLKDIDKDGFDEPEKRAEMLAKWQERFGRGATYEKLIDAMIKAGKKTEAEGVCQLIEPVTPVHCTAANPGSGVGSAGQAAGGTQASANTAVSKPNFDEMQKLKIIAKSANKYREIGDILLKDGDGTEVGNMKTVERDNPQLIVRAIYKQWMQEDEHCSWAKLAWCLRRVSLNPLAADIEQRYGLPPQAQEAAPGPGVGAAAATTSTPANTGSRVGIASAVTSTPSTSANAAANLPPVGTVTSKPTTSANTERVFRLAEKRGLAILVTCDYEDTPGITTLSATNKDAAEMKMTFEQFGYDIHQLKNGDATKPAVTKLLEETSQYLSTLHNPDKGKKRNKVIIFAFSGHGNLDQIVTNDREKLSLKEEILLPLVTHKAVSDIPKLFFIDACRGTDRLKHKTKGESDDGQKVPEQKAVKEYVEKGFTEVEGNYRMDYATIPDHVAYTDSKWMILLSRALRDDDENSFQNIADEVKRLVHEDMQHQQQCESVNRLNTGALYLQG